MSLPATVTAMAGSWERPARLIDLGLGGACVALADVLPPGTSIALVIDAPHLWDPLELEGVIAWTRSDVAEPKAIVGVKFEHASGATLRRMTELLETNLF